MAKKGNGEGTIYYSDKLNRWVGQCYINEKRKSFYGKTRKEVNQKMQEAKSQELSGTFIEKSEVTLAELAEEIINDKRNSNIINEGTYIRQLYSLKPIKEHKIGNIPLQKITPKHIKDFLNSTTPYCNNSIDKIYQLLGATFRRAIERDYIVKNPMLFEEVRKPKSDKLNKEVVSLSVEEHKKLLHALSQETSPYINIIYLMLFTGMRVGEVLALKKDSIDENYIHITQTITRDSKDYFKLGRSTKTQNSKRDITYSEDTKTILEDSFKNYTDNENNLLFCDTKTKNIITPNEVRSYLYRLNAKYDIAPHLSNHMLRHTYATRCIESGMNIKVLSKKLGHKKIDTTLNTYASVLEKFEVSEDDKLNHYFALNGLGLH